MVFFTSSIFMLRTLSIVSFSDFIIPTCYLWYFISESISFKFYYRNYKLLLWVLNYFKFIEVASYREVFPSWCCGSILTRSWWDHLTVTHLALSLTSRLHILLRKSLGKGTLSLRSLVAQVISLDLKILNLLLSHRGISITHILL